MENRLKHRISRIFRSSFGSSCRPRNVSDIMEKAISVSPIIDPTITSVHSKPRPFPSICKPKTSFQTNQIFDYGLIPANKLVKPPRHYYRRRRKVSEKHSPFFLSSGNYFNGRICPPASPISSLIHPQQFDFYATTKKPKSKNVKKPMINREKRNLFSSSSLRDYKYYDHVCYGGGIGSGGGGWWSSSEEEHEYDHYNETDTLFSSRSTNYLTSDSSEEHRRRHARRKTKSRSRSRGVVMRNEDKHRGVLPVKGWSEDGVKDSFAVVKSSSDPHADFTRSMVEMIVEKQIFGAEDLQNLLGCFLKLNSHKHHETIVQVFGEIYEALF